jgi:hypothetical protein
MLNANAKLNPISIAEEIIKGTEHWMTNAILYGVTEDGSYLELDRAPDIYDLLGREYPYIGLIGLAVHTTGWAAPLNEHDESDGQPSKHPERRRVALVTVKTVEGLGSALSFADEPVKIITDKKGGEQLSDALQECLLKMMWQGYWALVEDSDGAIFGEYLESPDTDNFAVAEESTIGEDHDF